MKNKDIYINYMPQLSISPAEMNALDELAEKDKDHMLPVFPIKGWAASKKLSNTRERIKKAIGNRPWIASIDMSCLEDSTFVDLATGEYKREVFKEISEIIDEENGFSNWFNYLSEIDEAIPSLIRITNDEQIDMQIENLCSLNRGLAVIFGLSDIDSGHYLNVLNKIKEANITDPIIIFDYGTVNQEIIQLTGQISQTITLAYSVIPGAVFSISATSFPDSFSGRTAGENSIYERRLFNIIKQQLPDLNLIYSDRGGAREKKANGGGGVPSPRIDYPLKNEWMFIRKEFTDSSNPGKSEREELYTEIAKEIVSQDYWNDELHIWGTEIIVYTSKGDFIGINSPARSTAVRLNIHMYNQIHYDEVIEDVDSDDDWED